MEITPVKAIELVRQKFPFEGYMDQSNEKYLNITKTVPRYLGRGDKILDFGSGPCDKTAMLQLLGFNCSACDDLRDHWHEMEGNRDRIISFAQGSGIDFRLLSNGPLPFEKGSFDMVMMHHVLEHLHDSPRGLVTSLLELAKPAGFLFVTVPSAVNIRKRIAVLRGKTNLPSFESYYWYPGPWRGHVREYTKGDLEKLSEFLHLDIIELRSCHDMLDKARGIIQPVYRFMTSIVRGWRDSWLLVARKRADWAPIKTPPQDELSKILGRAAFRND